MRARNRVAIEQLAKVMSPVWKGMFGSHVYDKRKFRPLYNFLSVRCEGDFVFGIGIDQIHVNAFDPIATRKQHIRFMLMDFWSPLFDATVEITDYEPILRILHKELADSVDQLHISF
jgi:hypothetical protein